MGKMFAPTSTPSQEYEVYPPAWYRVRLFDFEEKADPEARYGNDKYWVWKFNLLRKDYDGKQFRVITTPREDLAPGTKAGALVRALLDQPELPDALDLADLFGHECFVKIEIKNKENGKQSNVVPEGGWMSLSEATDFFSDGPMFTAPPAAQATTNGNGHAPAPARKQVEEELFPDEPKAPEPQLTLSERYTIAVKWLTQNLKEAGPVWRQKAFEELYGLEKAEALAKVANKDLEPEVMSAMVLLLEAWVKGDDIPF